MKSRRIEAVIASVFILLFVYTATSKWIRMDSFVVTLRQSPLIAKMAAVTGWLIITAELVIAGLLCLPSTRRVGLYGSLGIMTVFTGYIGYMLLTTSHLPCSCGGVISYMGWRMHLLFNIGLIVLAVSGLWLDRSTGSKLKT